MSTVVAAPAELTPVDDAAPPRARRAWPFALLVAVVLFCAVAPTLTSLEFSSGSENLNVGTVLEMRRVDPRTGAQGPWLIPTLKGAPRVIKPPLTAWVTAAFVGDDTVAALSTPDPAARAAAYERLAWEVRWPALVLACASLAFVFETGRVLTASVAGGVLAAAVAGVNLLLLRYGRTATTDVQLALWVAVANACLVKAWFEGRPWLGAVGGGVTIGLAVMSKGPVALVQTVLPVAVAYAVARWRGTRLAPPRDEPTPEPRPLARRLAPVALGAAIALLVAVPWYAYVWSQNPDIVDQWQKEVTREGATDLKPDPWYGYLTLPVLMLPWTVFFVAGVIATVRDAARGHARAAAAASLLVVPVLVMSLFRDKPDRYLLPLVGAAGVVCAWAMLGQLRPRPQRVAADGLLAVLHGVVLVLVAALPLAGALPAPQWGLPWYGWPFAVTVAGAGVAVAVVGMIAARRWGGATLAATVIAILIVNVGFVSGYRNTFNGRAELKPLADRIWQVLPPDAEVLYVRPERPKPLPLDLNIYTNRLAREIDDLSRERPRRWPQAAVVLQRIDDREPPPVAPAGWEPEGQFPAGERRTWHLFVRRPAGPRG